MGSGHAVERDILGCWLLKCNPTMWDVEAVIRDNVEVAVWGVADSYRSRMMQAGDPFLLWRTGKEAPGIVGTGVVTGSAYTVAGDDPSFEDSPYWLDKDFGSRVRLHCPIQLEFLRDPLPADVIRSHGEVSSMEIFRQPFMANPLFLNVAEYGAVQRMLVDRPEWKRQ